MSRGLLNLYVKTTRCSPPPPRLPPDYFFLIKKNNGAGGGGGCGSIVWGSSTKGLSTGTTSGKANFSKIIFIKMILLKLTKRPPRSSPGGFVANFSFSDNPRFIEALIATILISPSSVKCSLRFIFFFHNHY